MRLEVASRETYVGVPAQFSITIQNAREHQPPKIPEIPGATVQSLGPPSQSSQTTIINGQVSQSTTLTYNYALTAQQPGRLTIPAVDVVVDGETQKTQPAIIVVSKSDTGDLLFVEVQGARPSVYVGQELELTLQIWIRPYTDRRLGVTLSNQDMLKLVDRTSQWGVFQDALESINAREQARKDSQGVEHVYCLYEVHKKIYPERPGKLDCGQINVIVTYPNRLVRDIFSIRIADGRKIAAAANVAPVVIKDVPTKDRPAFYRGAVGRFQISASAKPTDVVVGDPITLVLTVNGQGRLESLLPPPLDQLEALSGFKVPADPPTGSLDAAGKHFTQSIRAHSEAVRQIPPLPFVYFDPDAEKFVTVHTAAIPLHVRGAAKLSDSEIVQAAGDAPGATRQLTEIGGGILANYSDMDEVLTDHSLRLGWPAALALAAPPLLFVASWLSRRHAQRLREDVHFARRRRARRSALKRLRSAGEVRSDNPGAVSAAAAEAIGGYIADRCNLPPGALTRAEVVRHLCERTVRQELIAQLDELLRDCEDLRYAGGAVTTVKDLADRTADLINRLERERF